MVHEVDALDEELERLRAVADRALKPLRALREDQDQQAVRSLVLKRQKLSRTAVRQFRLFLYVASLLLIGGLVHLGLRLRSRAWALQRRAAFEHVIVGVSMRFINARPQELAFRPPALSLGGEETVLVIEDDREQRRDEEILAALGYEPVGFARPEDAIASRLMASRRLTRL